MNFLELCKRLRSEAGIAGSGPVTTANQTGELLRVVDWVKDAYTDIQDKRDNWDFLRLDFSFNTTAGTAEYPKTTVTQLATWKRDSLRCYLTSSGVNDEIYLKAEPWNSFRNFRLRGANRDASGRPLYFTVKPDKSLVFWPKPDNTYTIVGEYFRKAYTFSSDTDEPVFDRHHLAIVYNALMRYAAYVGEPALYARAQNEYNRHINKIERDYTPAIGMASPLA